MKYIFTKESIMASDPFQRFAITVPGRMATQIDSICEAEGRNRSEFFREAVRVYLSARSRGPQFLMPTSDEEQVDNPFHTFTEWNSEADSVYDSLR
jgi:hypothetical protein